MPQGTDRKIIQTKIRQKNKIFNPKTWCISSFVHISKIVKIPITLTTCSRLARITFIVPYILTLRAVKLKNICLVYSCTLSFLLIYFIFSFVKTNKLSQTNSITLVIVFMCFHLHKQTLFVLFRFP